jgi:hypothetical protein
MLQNPTIETRRAFGFLFILVSIAIGLGTVISELASINGFSFYYFILIWIGSFGAVFGLAAARFRKVAPMIRGRIKSSVKWSTRAKVINGLCWAGPFVAIGAFPSFYQYFVLLGIGLGNFSTYILLKKYSGADNREQLVVAIISLVAIPIAAIIDSSLFVARQDIAVMVSRILIAIAYAAGGAYALSR